MSLAGLALLIAVCYFPATAAGFVWDDRAFTEAESIREWSGLRTIWFSPQDLYKEAHYWPILYTTFWLEHKLWEFSAPMYHIVNLIIHFFTTALLWRLLLYLSIPGAYCIAAVFAIHPVHVEPVVWVIGRKDLLSTLFYLSATWTYLRFVNASPPSRGSWRRYLLALALFIAGLLCKSIVVTLPVALLILHWWKRGRVTKTDLLRVMPFFLVAIGVAAGDFAFSRSVESVSLDYSIIDRIWIASYALWFYVGKLLWPTDLAVIYPHWEIWMHPWGYVLTAGAVVILLWGLRRRIGRGPLAGVLFFVVTLAPVLGFVDYGYMQFSFVADRYQYLASVGVMAVLIGVAAHHVHRLPKTWRRGIQGLMCAILVLLGTLTWQQSQIYKDEITFYQHIIAFNPVARSAHYNLGLALLLEGRWEEGLASLRIGLEQNPDNAKAWSNAGAALIMLGDYDEAERYLHRALELDPDQIPARKNMVELEHRRKHSQNTAP